MGNRLEGKVAVVTGAAGAIGFAIASEFAKEGAHVFVADISLDQCEKASRSIGGTAAAQQLDVTDLSSIEAMASRVVSVAGRIDILVNCAGVYGMENIVDATAAQFDRIIGINLRGLLFTLSAVARRMLADGKGGAIVNVASAAGRRGAAGSGIYSASKAAVISVTQTAAQELISGGIRVNAIAPGAVRTPMWDAVKVAYQAAAPRGTDIDVEAAQIAATPAGRLSTVDDYVGAAVFLACSDSDFIVGQTLNIDGGLYMN